MGVRDDEIGLVEAALGLGDDVVLEGPWGCGRSHVLAELVERLTLAGTTVVQVNGRHEVASQPGVALRAARLSALSPQGRIDVASTVDELAAEWGERPTVVAIDDVDALDGWSWAAIDLARQRTGSRIVGTRVRGLGAPPAAPVSEWTPSRLEDAVHVVLEPLHFNTLTQLLQARLGGPVDIEMVSRVLVRSGGLPRLAAAIVDAGRIEGRIRRDDGMWVERGGLWSPGLAGVVDPLLRGLDDGARLALQVLAVVGSVPVELALRLVGEQALGTLERHGLVATVGDAVDRLVVIYPSLVEEVLLRTPTDDRRAQAERRVVDVLGDAPTAARLPLTELPPFDVEAQPTPELVRVARARLRAIVASRRDTWRSTRHPRDAHEYVTSLLLVTNDPHAADEVWDSAHGSVDPYALAGLEALHARWVSMTGDQRTGLTHASAILDAARTGTDADVVLDVERLRLLWLLDRHPSVEAVVIDVPDSTPKAVADSARVQLAQLYLAGGAASRAGIVSEPFEDEVEQLVGRDRALLRDLLLVARGSVDVALEHALGRLEDARSRLDIGDMFAAAYPAGLAALLHGDFARARRILTSVLAFGRVGVASAHLELGCLTQAALACARLGDQHGAESFARQAEASPVHDGPFPVMSTAWVRSELRWAEGDLAGASDVLWSAALDHSERGWSYAAATEAVAALELGPESSRLPVAERICRENDVPLVDPLLRYIEALVAAEPDALLRSSRELAGFHLFGRAYSCARAANVAAERDGQPRLRADAVAQEQLLAKVLGPENIRAAYSAGTATLTDREREIVQLVVGGMTNGQVADRLVLSVRTVENHLHRIYRKTGANSREQLAQILQGRGIA